MTSSDNRVIVTFVGGPLHGLQQELDAPPERFWRDLPNGSALLYGCRWRSDATGGHAVYSPVGMSPHAYRELLQTVDLERHGPVAAALQDAPGKHARGTS
jgi:hypothetical protein